MEQHWDVIIVGARCAGATLASLLAREGLRTLLLDGSARGTNMPMSTHLVQAPGMDVLDRLGLGARVRACTPESARLSFALDDAEAIGHYKDFVTGQGMTDAFLDAERMAATILDGRDEAFAHYWRERDVATLPRHFDATRQGAVGYNEPFLRCVMGRIAVDPVLKARTHLVLDHKLEPSELVPTRTMLAMVGAALLRGRFDVAAGFPSTGRQLGREARELADRKQLLELARADLARATLTPRLSSATQPASVAAQTAQSA